MGRKEWLVCWPFCFLLQLTLGRLNPLRLIIQLVNRKYLLMSFSGCSKAAVFWLILQSLGTLKSSGSPKPSPFIFIFSVKASLYPSATFSQDATVSLGSLPKFWLSIASGSTSTSDTLLPKQLKLLKSIFLKFLWDNHGNENSSWGVECYFFPRFLTSI